MPMRRESKDSRRWLGQARFSTVLLKSTINSSCSRRKAPVKGLSPVFSTTPSLTHCQNCVCVVQNCFLSRQMMSAVFFLLFLFALIGPICSPHLRSETHFRARLRYSKLSGVLNGTPDPKKREASLRTGGR